VFLTTRVLYLVIFQKPCWIKINQIIICFISLYFITTRGRGKTKFGRYYIQISEIDRIEVMELISLKRKLYKRTGIEENTRVNRLKWKKKITKKKRNNFPLETNKQSGLCVCGSFSKCIHLLCSRMHCCHCLWIKKNAATPLSPWKVGEFFPIFYSLKKNIKKKVLF
jgi:hypothetical protein